MALVELHESVADWPIIIEVGEMEMLTEEGKAGTNSMRLDLEVMLGLFESDNEIL